MSRSKPLKQQGSKSAAPVTAARAPQRSSAQEQMLMSGLSAFHQQHQSIYKSRWLRSLYPALLHPHPSVAVLNAHLTPRQLQQVRQDLTAQGARRWLRGGGADEIEAWRFEDDMHTATDAVGQQLAQTSLEGSSSGHSIAPFAANTPVDEDYVPSGRFIPPSPLDPNSPLLPYYLLDGASLLAVDALQVSADHAVLDVCAAPGGKSVCIMQRLDIMSGTGAAAVAPVAPGTLATAPPRSMLHANEPQGSRRVRLQGVLDEYVPPAVRKNRARIEVTPWDATRVALPQGRYDRVLVDAPCSSDRHVLQSAGELAAWSAKRIKTNAERQVLLLLNALRATKIGGMCVYATCSLSRRENDEVIDAVLDKLSKNARNAAKGQRVLVKVLPIRLIGEGVATPADAAAAGSADADEDVLRLPMGEPTRHGWMVLPDQVMHSLPGESAASASAPIVSDSADAAAATAPAASSTPVAASSVGHGFGPLYFCRLKRVATRDASEGGDSDSEEDSDDSDVDSDDGELEPRQRPDRQLPLEEEEEDRD